MKTTTVEIAELELERVLKSLERAQDILYTVHKQTMDIACDLSEGVTVKEHKIEALFSVAHTTDLLHEDMEEKRNIVSRWLNSHKHIKLAA